MKRVMNGLLGYDQEGEFCETLWYLHIGINTIGFNNGLNAAGFEGLGKERIENSGT